MENRKLEERIENKLDLCGYGFADETICEEPYKTSEQEREERKAASLFRKEANELDRATKRCMESALTALRELSEANNNDATQHFRSYALTDLRVQQAASLNRRDREDTARVAAAEAVAGAALGLLGGVPRKGRRGEGDRGAIDAEDMAKVAAAKAVAGAALGLLRGVPSK